MGLRKKVSPGTRIAVLGAGLADTLSSTPEDLDALDTLDTLDTLNTLNMLDILDILDTLATMLQWE